MMRLGVEKGNESSRGEKGFNSSKELFLSPFLQLLFAVRLQASRLYINMHKSPQFLTLPIFAELLILEH